MILLNVDNDDILSLYLHFFPFSSVISISLFQFSKVTEKHILPVEPLVPKIT